MDIQTEVVTRLGSSIQAIDQVGNAFDRLANKTRKANKETQDLQSRVSKHFKQSAEAASKIGGPLGSVGGRILGGIGMGGGFGAAAGGLALLTASFNALSAASDRAVDAVTRQAEAEDKLAAARDKGQKAMDAQALAGAAQAPGMRSLIAMGGEGAQSRLDSLESDSRVPHDTAVKALKDVMVAFPGQALSGDTKAGRTLKQADLLHRLGMDFGEAVQGLIESGGMGEDNSARRSTARVFKNATGQRGDPEVILQQAVARVFSNQFLINEDEAAKKLGKKPKLERDRSDRLPGMAKDTIAEATDPLSAAILEVTKIQQAQIDLMKKQVEAENGLVAYLRTAGRAYGLSQGSAQQKVDDQIIANSGATFSTPTAPKMTQLSYPYKTDR